MTTFGDIFKADTKFFDGWSDDDTWYYYPVEITKNIGNLVVGQKFAVAKFTRRDNKIHFYNDMNDAIPVFTYECDHINFPSI